MYYESYIAFVEGMLWFIFISGIFLIMIHSWFHNGDDNK
jgi:hypothetical protein